MRKRQAVELLDTYLSGSEPDREPPSLPPELESLAQLATLLSAQRAMPRAHAERARARFLDAAARRSSQVEQRALPVGGAAVPPWWRSVRLALVLAAFLAMATLAGVGVVQASESSLPGDFFYPFKRAGEAARLLVSRGPDAQAPLLADLSRRRAGEVAAVLTKGRVASVEFVGPLRAMQADRWVIGEFVVSVTDATRLEGHLSVGMLVSVKARSFPDRTLLATEVRSVGGIWVGTVEAIDGKVWTVDGRRVWVAGSASDKQVALGDQVELLIQEVADDTLLALEVEEEGEEPADGIPVFDVAGELQSMNGMVWRVAGRNILLTVQTRVEGTPRLGDWVKARVVRAGGGQWLALEIEIERRVRPPQPTPVPVAPTPENESPPPPTAPVEADQPEGDRAGDEDRRDSEEHDEDASDEEEKREEKPPDDGDD